MYELHVVDKRTYIFISLNSILYKNKHVNYHLKEGKVVETFPHVITSSLFL